MRYKTIHIGLFRILNDYYVERNTRNLLDTREVSVSHHDIQERAERRIVRLFNRKRGNK